MTKPAIALLLLVPLIASAECGFTRSGNTMTIVINKGGEKCFSSTNFREAFKADITATMLALEEEELQTSRQKKAFDQRNTRSQKLWNLQRAQTSSAGGTPYFGQRP